jgi:GTPase involved in cell partitioning and DNA repair
MSIAAYILFTVLIICVSLIIMLKTWIDYKLDLFCHADDVIETQTKILSLQREVISLERQLYKKDENIIMNKQEQFAKLQNENFKESSRLSGLV